MAVLQKLLHRSRGAYRDQHEHPNMLLLLSRSYILSYLDRLGSEWIVERVVRLVEESLLLCYGRRHHETIISIDPDQTRLSCNFWMFVYLLSESQLVSVMGWRSARTTSR